MYFGIGLLYLIGIISRTLTERQIKILTAIWAVLALILMFVVYNKFPAVILIIYLIKIPLVYLWLKLLSTYSDTIGRFLLILLLGGVILGII